jgi:four helix bundle protein
MSYVKSFRDLEVYQIARQLAKEIFEISKDFPKEEIYSLTSQIRRSSRSVGAQIAEAWGKRRYIKHFESKLTDAEGEQLETQHWLETSLDHNYITQQTANDLIERYEVFGKKLGSMISKSESFCGKL